MTTADERMGDRLDGRTTDMRDRILAVARELFEVQGFAATSLRDIADRLDVSKAALYYHFQKKADLIRSVILPMADDLDAWFDRVETNDLTPRELFEDYFDVVYRHRDLINALGRDPASMEGTDIAARVGSWISRSQDLFGGPDAPIERRIRAAVAVSGLARCIGFFPDASMEQLRTVAVEAALDALGDR